MSKYFLDTNAIADLFSGKNSIDIISTPVRVYISIISVAEYLSSPYLTASQLKQFNRFCNRVEVVNFSLVENPELINLTVKLRKQYKRKLPDTIIAASAIHKKAVLISRDTTFQGIKELHLKLTT